MHIAKVPNRNARPAILLRETYREDGKGKNRALANLSKLPAELGDLATLTRKTICFAGQKALTVQTTPTAVQRRAFGLLGIDAIAA